MAGCCLHRAKELLSSFELCFKKFSCFEWKDLVLPDIVVVSGWFELCFVRLGDKY